MARAKRIEEWRPPQNRAEYLAEKDESRAMRREWRDLDNRTTRPGFDKLNNMRYKGGK